MSNKLNETIQDLEQQGKEFTINGNKITVKEQPPKVDTVIIVDEAELHDEISVIGGGHSFF